MFRKAQSADFDRPAVGHVVLVGAGPGAADLITIRGQRALISAEVLVYDDLVGPGILEMCSASAERIYVGKRSGKHAVPQEEIGAILVRKAQEGRNVVRLKGGDPLIFGRGGEEALVLAAAGIAFEIVPGVTAAAAAGAMSGIPLTHRDHASAVLFVTGHECAGKSSGRSVNWQALAASGATLCIYMGVKRLPAIAQALREGGMPDTTPVAVVINATLPGEKIHLTQIGAPDVLPAESAGQPAIIIVGEVVRVADVIAEARRQVLAG